MAFQFVHVSVYSREKPKKQGKGKDRKWTVQDIAGEAERKPENSPHVATPKEFAVVFGVKPTEAAAEAQLRAEASKDVSGRKIRKDTPVMLAGVASHPATVEELVDPAIRRQYEKWKQDALAWMKRKYGDNLLSVVEHLDERHPHLHFYAVPKMGRGFNAKSLHDGFIAAHEAKNPAQQKKLYCDGMRGLQDDYFFAVGAGNQQARLGPRRRRLTRSEWSQEQHQLAQLSKLLRAGKTTLAKAKKQARFIIQQAKGDSQKLGLKVGAFFSGVAGRARDALQAAERARDLERLKLDVEKENRKKVEKELEETRRRLIHERIVSDQRVENLVAMKLLPLEKQLVNEAAERTHATMGKKPVLGGLLHRKQSQTPKPE